MDKDTLKQYRSLVKEVPKLKRDIARLYERLENVPEISGKVSKSSDDFPYIIQHVKVKMAEPKKASEIRKQIRIKEMRIRRAEQMKTEIEEFIAGIQNSEDRMIFERVFMDGERQNSVADDLGFEKSTVTKKMDKYLKLSTNSTFYML